MNASQSASQSKYRTKALHAKTARLRPSTGKTSRKKATKPSRAKSSREKGQGVPRAHAQARHEAD
jgi:hypothetical protein